MRDRLEAKVDAVETKELCLQVVLKMRDTASVEKRHLMAHVLANGLADASLSAGDHRYFLRAVTALDIDHVAFLRMVCDAGGVYHRPLGGLDAVLAADLLTWRLLGTDRPPRMQISTRVGDETRIEREFVESAEWRLTTLGAKLIAYLKTPTEE